MGAFLRVHVYNGLHYIHSYIGIGLGNNEKFISELIKHFLQGCNCTGCIENKTYAEYLGSFPEAPFNDVIK